jgi:hypothetical protein
MQPSSAGEPWSQVASAEGDDRTPIVAGGGEEVVGEARMKLVLHERLQKLSPFTLGPTDLALHLT